MALVAQDCVSERVHPIRSHGIRLFLNFPQISKVNILGSFGATSGAFKFCFVNIEAGSTKEVKIFELYVDLIGVF